MSIISCNFSSLHSQSSTHSSPKPHPGNSQRIVLNYATSPTKHLHLKKLEKDRLHRPHLLSRFCCFSSLDTEQNPKEPFLENGVSLDEREEEDGSNSGGGGEEMDWTSSFLLSGLYAGLMYYVFILAPNQTPSTDMYFLKKLLNLTGDDGFRMNEVIVALWYIMGIYPLVYSMLLLPSARSQRNGLPVWPFLLLSFFLGAYGLIPYFILWRPPPPAVEEAELRSWPLNFLDSKLTAGISLAAGLGLMVYAGLSNADVWAEFYLFFRSSRFIHAMTIDFALLSTFAPFWVYNDMTARKWYDRGSWLLPVSLIPLVGPLLYLVLRHGVTWVTPGSKVDPPLPTAFAFISAGTSYPEHVGRAIVMHPEISLAWLKGGSS